MPANPARTCPGPSGQTGVERSAASKQADVRKVLQMGAVDLLLISETLPDETIEEFENLAKNLGTKVMIISEETREGVQLRDIGKFAAILRYEIGESAYQY